MVIRGIGEIREAYRSDGVARGYIDARFAHALGALLHARQAQALVDVIARHQPRRVLEIAPGPARLTTAAARAHPGSGVFVDASAQMLREAQRRLGADSRWRGIQGDAFNLPFAGPFDLVYSFRLIRHFDAPDRTRLYQQIARVLAPRGLLLFDAVNEQVSRRLRENAPDEYRHFDAMFTRAQLLGELAQHGFETLELRGVQHYFELMQSVQVMVAPRSNGAARLMMETLDRLPGGKPLEWIVLCRKR